MHIDLEKHTFLKALSRQQNVIERRATIPVLNSLLLEASLDDSQKGRLTLTGTDLEVCLEEVIEATVHVAGKVAIPAHILYDVVRKLGSDTISLKLLPEKGLELTCASSQFVFPSTPLDDFPSFKKASFSSELPFEVPSLRKLIDQTRFAMSQEEARYYLNGIYFHLFEGSLRAVATDAHRLALSWVTLEDPPESFAPFIISKKAVQEIRKLADEEEKNITFFLSERQIACSVKSATFYSRLVEGKFPDYTRAIPESRQQTACIACPSFSQAVDRVSMVSGEKNRPIKLKFSPQCLTVLSQNSQHGSACETLTISYTGSVVEMGFSARYILDILQQIKGETVHFHLQDALSPSVLSDPEDAKALYVLMPMRI